MNPQRLLSRNVSAPRSMGIRSPFSHGLAIAGLLAVFACGAPTKEELTAEGAETPAIESRAVSLQSQALGRNGAALAPLAVRSSLAAPYLSRSRVLPRPEVAAALATAAAALPEAQLTVNFGDDALVRSIAFDRTATVAHGGGSRARMIPKSTEPLLRSKEVLATYKELFGLSSGVVGQITLLRHRKDDLGYEHTRVQQMHQGVPVYLGEAMVHTDPSGAVNEVYTTMKPQVSVKSVVPKLSADEATAIARRAFYKQYAALREPQEFSKVAELWVLPGKEGSPDCLAYQATVAANGLDEEGAFETEALAFWIDAQSGDVLSAEPTRFDLTASGKNFFGTTRQFNVIQDNDLQGVPFYAMVDETHPGGTLRTLDAKNRSLNLKDKNESFEFTSRQRDAGWDEKATDARGAAVDAHYYLGKIVEQVKTKFGRYYFFTTKRTFQQTPTEEKGVLSVVHASVKHAGASYEPTTGQLVFGDGDDSTIKLVGMSSAFDVVVHEYFHGVTAIESGLVYKNESGALNEAVSDVFAALFEAETLKGDDANAWVIGETVAKRRWVRNMRNPADAETNQPRHMKEFVKTTQDAGGVHANSGIINHAAYLMTKGGTNLVSRIGVPVGIGIDKSFKLWKQLSTEHFLSGTTFRDAADMSLAAAKELNFNENEQAIVECAWIATGVVEGECLAKGTVPANQFSGTGAGDEKIVFSKDEVRPVEQPSSCSAAPRSGSAGLQLGGLGLLAIALLRRRTFARSVQKS
jgi:bacillolysin